ncbi:hypothetical protein L226DRAFT_198357 [Lentinus tigrinus ALCF2SS1-7]|uniref:uncharacterized protein n=1 Tax=Lentinus tigrinus ALCF2SS1-7 TaxID=1328758 RepID=UPI00116613AE|nr:hypothetical protein L226DRAFT_198357 [Lentinus tigrinus ALCF2SS1-7]
MRIRDCVYHGGRATACTDGDMSLRYFSLRSRTLTKDSGTRARSRPVLSSNEERCVCGDAWSHLGFASERHLHSLTTLKVRRLHCSGHHSLGMQARTNPRLVSRPSRQGSAIPRCLVTRSQLPPTVTIPAFEVVLGRHGADTVGIISLTLR